MTAPGTKQPYHAWAQNVCSHMQSRHPRPTKFTQQSSSKSTLAYQIYRLTQSPKLVLQLPAHSAMPANAVLYADESAVSEP